MKYLIWLLCSISLLISSPVFAGLVLSGASPTLNYCQIYKSMLQANVATATINNCTIYYTHLEADDNLALNNSIVYNTYSTDITIAAGKTVTGTDNIFQDAAKAGTGTYTNVAGTQWSTNPLFTSATDFTLQSGSPARKHGTPISGLHGTDATDMAGKSLKRYNLNREIDIGAYQMTHPFNWPISDL